MTAPSSNLEELPFCLARTGLDFRRFNDLTLQSAGLKELAPGYATVLHALMDLGDSTVNSLVEQTHLPNGTLTGLLDGLEKEGHLKRIPNPKDGRSWLVQLTAKGKKVCKQLDTRHRKVVKLLGETLSQKEAAVLTRLLDKLSASLREYRVETKSATKSKTSAGQKAARKH